METNMKSLNLIMALVFVSTLIYAQVPNKISYQGLLTTSTGTPVQDGKYNLQFDIYNLPAGGSLKYTETQTGIPVSKGTFSVILHPTSTIFAESLFVEVRALAGPSISTPITFSPRSVLSSSPYALAPWISNGNNIYYSRGNVGIGVSAPTQKLEIAGAVSATMLEDRDDNAYFVDPNNSMNSASLNGSVGIGLTMSPTAKLDVNGDIRGNQIISTAASPTAPLNVTSSTVVPNLNADMVDGQHANNCTQIRYDGTLAASGTITLVIPHYTIWTLQLSSGTAYFGGLCFVQGFENGRIITITYLKYNGDGTSAYGGAEGVESTTTTLVSFGVSPFNYSVQCSGEATGDHNIVLTAGTSAELKYRLIY